MTAAELNVELLSSWRSSEADLEHIAEEIEDMGKREQRSLHNRLVRLTLPLPSPKHTQIQRASSCR